MTRTLSPNRAMTLGDVARRYGIKTWMVRRIFENGTLPEPSRLGQYRVLYPDELPAVEAALRRAGYLPALALVEIVP